MTARLPSPPLLGLSGCTDLVVDWDAEALERLASDVGIDAEPDAHPASIGSLRELVQSVLWHIGHGAGGEYPLRDGAVAEAFASAFSSRRSLGGTAARAAVALARSGQASTVHLMTSDAVTRSLLPPSSSALTGTLLARNEPHLIVQYPAGARVRLPGATLIAPRANRMIFAPRQTDARRLLAPGFAAAAAAAPVVLISGLNTFTDEAELRSRLGEIARALGGRRDGRTVLYEEGGFHEPRLAGIAARALAATVDAVSMNEDEARQHLGRGIELRDPGDIARALADLADITGARTVIVHTERWAAAYGHHADSFRPSLLGGVAQAACRYVHGDDWTAADLDSMRARVLAGQETGLGPVVRHDRAVELPLAFVDVPEITCASPTTVGLGDTFVGGMVLALARRG